MDNVVKVQKDIRNNVDEMHNFVNSLQDWEKEMKNNDELLKLTSKENIMKGELALKHDEADKHKNKGNNLVKLGKWKEALSEYSASIALYPDDAIYYGNRSYCHMQLKNWEAAENDCNRALELKSDYVKVALRRANIRRKRGDLKGAARDYNLVLIIEPKNSTAIKEYEDLYPELKKHFATLGITLPEFNEMNLSLKTEEELKPTDLKSAKKNDQLQTLNSLLQSNIKNKQELNVKNLKKQDSNNRFLDYSLVYPESFKPPHLRSKLPLRRIKIEDVYSNEDDEFPDF